MMLRSCTAVLQEVFTDCKGNPQGGEIHSFWAGSEKISLWRTVLKEDVFDLD
jgi:hypothetical protein